jgi:hypothetical protein
LRQVLIARTRMKRQYRLGASGQYPGGWQAVVLDPGATIVPIPSRSSLTLLCPHPAAPHQDTPTAQTRLATTDLHAGGFRSSVDAGAPGLRVLPLGERREITTCSFDPRTSRR